MGPGIATAQSVKAQSISATGSTQIIIRGNTHEIKGGTVRGNDGNLLFHEFESFSLGSEETAFFNPDDITTNIETILSIVAGSATGGSLSQIDGTIRAGNVDIFFVNPRGIQFGATASLDIGGDFIASTAERILFSNDIELSTDSPQSIPMLIVSQPVGLSLGEISGSIVNESRVISSAVGIPGGLEVLPNHSLVLIGNGITLSSGGITLPSGHIELASLGPGSSVGLISPNVDNNMSWMLSYEDDNQNLSDIRLSSDAFIYGTDFGVSGNLTNSSVRLTGQEILLDSSDVFADNFGTGPGRDLIISASEKLILSNGALVSASASSTNTGGNLSIDATDGVVELLDGSTVRTGAGIYGTVSDNSGRLTLNATSLLLQDESAISTSTFSQGNAGNIEIAVLEGTVSLLGGSRLLAQSSADAAGDAGSIAINAENLSIRDGSEVSTLAQEMGVGGDLIVNTVDGVTEVIGVSSDGNRGSFLQATTEGGGEGGGIQINTRTLLVQDGGAILSGTSGTGNSGNIAVNAAESVIVTGAVGDSFSQISSSAAAGSESGDPFAVTGSAGFVYVSTERLEVSNGASIFTTTRSAGQGGELAVRADEVVLSGQGNSGQSGLFARTAGAGDSGKLTLIADMLRIENGARFTVSTVDGLLSEDFTVEDVGTVRGASINARRILLNDGQITAEALSGNGGTLDLTVQDVLLLRSGSLVSATAGTAESGGNGGSVRINSPSGLILAVPNENSDIIANAFSGTGGNINIIARNILGVEAGRATPGNISNDIDASSQFGSSGTIALNNLEVDPTQGPVELPTNLSSPNQVAQRCLADSDRTNAFVITGQGGAPPSPSDIVRNETAGLIDFGEETTAQEIISTPVPPVRTTPTEDLAEMPLVEAEGWQRDESGEVVLLAETAVASTVSTVHVAACSQQARRAS